jgi:hypothetical protein
VDQPAVVDGALVHFRVDEHVVRRVLRFVSATRCLSQTLVLKRRIGKGSALYVSSRLAVPVPQTTRATEDAIRLYDQRMPDSMSSFYRSGTVVPERRRSERMPDLEVAAALVHRIEEDWISVPLWRDGHEDGRDVFARFLRQVFSVENLQALSLDPRLGGQIWGDDAAVMLALAVAAIHCFHALPNALTTVVQVGFFVCDERLLLGVLGDVMPHVRSLVTRVLPGCTLPEDAVSLVTRLAALEPSLQQGLYGAPIRRAGRTFLVDLYGATQRLQHAFEFPSVQGAQANARADHFEKSVQVEIDRSPWKPSEQLSRMQRRTLRFNGAAITDLDAIGERDGVAIVASCKSRVYSNSYHAGDFATVRNAATMVERAVAQASGVVAFLTANPVGDNYDFHNYSRLLMPVVTPIAIYTRIGPETAFLAPGLRAAVSFSELSRFLMGKTDH